MPVVLLFAVLGLGTGALVAGIAVGVVLCHRGGGVINLAVGAVAMVAGYAFWSLRTGFFGVVVGTPVAVVAALAVAASVGVLMEYVAFRPLRTAPPLARLVASLGILLVAQAAMVLTFGTAAKPAPSILPAATVVLSGVTVPVNRLVLAGIVVVLTVLLAVGYRFSRFGLATRAAAEDDSAARLAGLSPDRLALGNTVLACLVVGLLGILSAALTQLDAVTLPLQVVPALAAALFARFTSLAVACGAGLAIGVAQSLMYYTTTLPWFPTDGGNALPGVTHLLVFGLIVLAMFWRGATLPVRGEPVDRKLPAAPVTRRLRRTVLLSAVCGATLLIVLPYDFRQAFINSLIGAVIVMSYVVITGYIGQLSVVQLALSGAAGFTLSHLLTDAGLGTVPAAFAAIAVATGLGVLTGVGALRARGVSLAVVTLAAALAIEQFGFVNSGWGGGTGGAPVAAPQLFGVDLGPAAPWRGLDGAQPSPVFGFVVLAVAVVIGGYVAHLRRTALGRWMLAVRANERAAAASGVDVPGVKLLAFAISSGIAGVAGVLYAYNFGSVSATRFSALSALGLIAFAYIGGVTMVSGAVLAGLLATGAVVPHALERWFGLSGNWALLAGGVGLLVTLLGNPEGVAGVRRGVRA